LNADYELGRQAGAQYIMKYRAVQKKPVNE